MKDFFFFYLSYPTYIWLSGQSLLYCMPKQVVLLFFFNFSKVALTTKAVENNFTSPDLPLFFSLRQPDERLQSLTQMTARLRHEILIIVLFQFIWHFGSYKRVIMAGVTLLNYRPKPWDRRPKSNAHRWLVIRDCTQVLETLFGCDATQYV